MAGGGDQHEVQFKGWRKHFNTYTLTGRANITYATFSVLGLIGLYMVLKPKKKTQS